MNAKAITTTMNGNWVEVLVIGDTWLDAEKFSFVYNASKHQFRLVKYLLLSKPTSRHKFRVVKIWDWYRERTSNTEPPKPTADIVQAVKDKFLEELEWITEV